MIAELMTTATTTDEANRGADDRPKIRHYLTDADVPDPWGKEAADFADCAALIDYGADQHIA
ncbi:low molecular weight phosphatase family protein [Micromonospora rubida]|uniref:hypothetical protein n=1 Tax=Micromonospora rubida TaxID=2697657 RepID=UPI001376AB2E|nr:hypothetical protein [Micromonospora rubida]NBE85371.1 hypothetical protein [Micromonospora rubida]